MILTKKIIVNIIPASQVTPTRYTIRVTVLPAETTAQTTTVTYPFLLNVSNITVNVTDPILAAARQFLDQIYANYIDESRNLRTLLNLGNDRQLVALNWRNGTETLSGQNTLQVKLLNPLPDDVGFGQPAFVSKELAKSVIDTFKVRFAPDIDNTPYLRPKNTSVKVHADLGKSLNQVTYKLLQLQTGSLGSTDNTNNITFEDQIYRRWYSFDFNSSELNLDFSDYAKFVFYGSATMRLAAFREKLQQLEKLESQRQQFDGNVFTGELASAGAKYILEQSAKLARDKETLIRSFDRYEQYLFHTPSGSNSPYTTSFDYVDGGVEYNPIGYWPKIGTQLAPVSSEVATEWYATQSMIAQRFDEFNENNLINTIPTHIREHAADNGSYITFVAMIGHFFDNIKPYIDQYPNIYSRFLDPNEELSKDLVTDVADAVGFPLPTLNSIYDLSDSVLGTVAETPRRDYTVETHKRLLHNFPYFAKAKGTKTALSMLLKIFGISEQLLRVTEVGSSTPTTINSYEEYSTGIVFQDTMDASIILPISASRRTPYPAQLQFDVRLGTASPMTIATGGSLWALRTTLHPDNTTLARFELTSGSNYTPILTSSYYDMFGDKLLNVTLRNYQDTQQSALTVYHIEDTEVLYESHMVEASSANTFIPLWNQTNNIHLGGSGSLVQQRFVGLFDEIRVWGKNLSNEMVLNNAFDPGSIAGDTYTDPPNLLYIQLSFASALSGSLVNSLRNESPYIAIGAFPSLNNIQTRGITVTSNLFTRYLRWVRQVIPSSPFAGYTTQKIQVAPPPVFTPVNITANGVKQLSRTASIVAPQTKRIQRGRNKVNISVSPTEIINKNILRTLGFENINVILGAPTPLYTELSSQLEALKKYYSQYYYVNVNINNFIRILSEVNSVLNEVVEYFIPSKATLLNGVVIEQNLLEQLKVSPIKKLRVYGRGTRKTLAAPGSLTGSAPDYEATFNVEQIISVVPEVPVGTVSSVESFINAESQVLTDGLVASYLTNVEPPTLIDPLGTLSTISGLVTTPSTTEISAIPSQYTTVIDVPDIVSDVSATQPTYTSSVIYPKASAVSTISTYDLQHPTWPEYIFISESNSSYKKLAIDMGFANLNKIKYNDVNFGSEGAEPYNRSYPRKLFTYEIEALRPGGVTSISPAGYTAIPPSADFDDFGVTTFFNRTTGIYYVPQTFLTPRSTTPLNQIWDFEEQEFDTVSTWEYGNTYNFNDVVYQDVQDTDIELPTAIISAAKAGNRRYYVLTTRPSYEPPSDGTFYYSGSVPTYIPPSLDRDNWKRLFFKPIERRVPKRAIFDTFVVPDPQQNNYAITTLNIDTVVDIPERYIDTFNVGSIPPNGKITGELSVQNIATLFALQASVAGIRIRLYRTATAQAADINRPILNINYQNTGVLLDIVVSAANTVTLVNTIATLVADSVPPVGKIYYTIDNLTPIFKLGVGFDLYYFAVQIEPRIPQKYLPKHYRFFRENYTALKRRNWLGCKNTEETTIDGLSPVQVFIGEGTALTISPTTTNDEIVPGGGGTLDIT